ELSQLRQLQNTIETDVKITFNQALMLKKQHALSEELVDLSRQIRDKAVIRVNTGEAPPYESLKAQVDLATAENALLSLHQRQENIRLDLLRLLGMGANVSLIPEGDLTFDPISPDPDSLLEIAERQHPELLLSELHLTGQKLHQKQARADLIPNFKIRLFQTETASGVNAVSYGGELALSIPLWAPLKNRGAIEEARHLKNAAEWHRKEIRKNIHFQLQKSLNRLETATRQMTSYQQNTLQQSRELQRIVTRSYEEGAMSYLEVTEALRSIVTIKSGYLEAIFNCLAAEAELMQAIGGKNSIKSEQ
ncbi:TolC family protein, partial [bacterium]|nr:TolC family protein [bacterium]